MRVKVKAVIGKDQFELKHNLKIHRGSGFNEFDLGIALGTDFKTVQEAKKKKYDEHDILLIEKIDEFSEFVSVNAHWSWSCHPDLEEIKFGDGRSGYYPKSPFTWIKSKYEIQLIILRWPSYTQIMINPDGLFQCPPMDTETHIFKTFNEAQKFVLSREELVVLSSEEKDYKLPEEDVQWGAWA